MADTFIALQDLTVGRRIVAHRAGSVVPEGNIKRNGWEDLTARSTTKAAKAVVTESHEVPATLEEANAAAYETAEASAARADT